MTEETAMIFNGLSDRKCDCDMCKEFEYVRNFRDKLPPELRDEFYAFYDSIFSREAEKEMELAVLESKIQGSWPAENEYYHRIGDKLYKITSTLVEETKPNKTHV